MKNPLVKCSRCNGAGKVPLSESLRKTLDAVKQLGEATATEIHSVLKLESGITSVNNQLEDLRAIGMLKRKRDGKVWKYFISRS